MHKTYTVLVRMEGLEPPHFSVLDPKSSASTNSATSAGVKRRYQKAPSQN